VNSYRTAVNTAARTSFVLHVTLNTCNYWITLISVTAKYSSGSTDLGGWRFARDIDGVDGTIVSGWHGHRFLIRSMMKIECHVQALTRTGPGLQYCIMMAVSSTPTGSY
jgi:hypothetical protein